MFDVRTDVEKHVMSNIAHVMIIGHSVSVHHSVGISLFVRLIFAHCTDRYVNTGGVGLD